MLQKCRHVECESLTRAFGRRVRSMPMISEREAGCRMGRRGATKTGERAGLVFFNFQDRRLG
jgi:hypothetical protein